MASFLLIDAAGAGDLEEVRRLLIDGSDVNEENEGGFSALIYPAIYGHLEIVSLLIESGARIDHQDKDGCTALHWASSFNHLPIVSLLIEKGADLNITNNSGWSPLLEAAFDGYSSIVFLLLQHGADASLMDKLGNTALDWAREYNKSDCVVILENYEHFYRYRKVWLSFSTSLRSFQDNQNQEFKESQSPSMMKMMDSSDLVRYVTEFM